MTVYGISSTGTVRFREPVDEDSDGDDYGGVPPDDLDDSMLGDREDEPEDGPPLNEEPPAFLYDEYLPEMSKHSEYRHSQARRWMYDIIPNLIPVFLRVLRQSTQLRDFSGVTPEVCSEHCSQQKIDVLCISFHGTRHLFFHSAQVKPRTRY